MNRIFFKTICLVLCGAAMLCLCSCGDSGTVSGKAAEELVQEITQDTEDLVGFVTLEPTAGLENPWAQVSGDDIGENLGVSFVLPEQAGNVAYFWAEAIGTAEAFFTVDGIDYTQRMEEATEFTDISGLYYEWETEEETTVDFYGLTITGTLRTTADDGKTISLLLWYDQESGIMNSLTASVAEGETVFG